MALKISELTLVNWRNTDVRTIAFGQGMTVLAGPNASGKTNTVEALQLLTTGVSFRSPRAQELVMTGQQKAQASLTLTGDGRLLEVSCQADLRLKRFTRNGKSARPHEVAGTLLSVLFTPDDLDLVKRSPRFRRQELDAFGAQVSPGFARVCRTYTKSIEQRNRLLKNGTPDVALLSAWDESVALGAATVLIHRHALWRELSAYARNIYAELSGGEELSSSYVNSLGDEAAGFENISKEQLQNLIYEKLQQNRVEDLARGVTTIGPHRDDLQFFIDQKDARTFASQGQQRTVVLAWKLAQVAFCEERLRSRPLLLLDDVMSELDQERRMQVSRVVSQGIQTVATTTHLGYFDPDFLKTVEVVTYERTRNQALI